MKMGCKAKMESFKLKLFWPIDQSEWAADPLAPDFYSPVQNDIGWNFGDRPNLVTCEYSFLYVTLVLSSLSNEANCLK